MVSVGTPGVGIELTLVRGNAVDHHRVDLTGDVGFPAPILMHAVELVACPAGTRSGTPVGAGRRSGSPGLGTIVTYSRGLDETVDLDGAASDQSHQIGAGVVSTAADGAGDRKITRGFEGDRPATRASGVLVVSV